MSDWINPRQDGFHMPAEFEPHLGCIMVWPTRPGSWPNGAKAARIAFLEVIRAISKSEIVYVAAEGDAYLNAREALKELLDEKRVVLFEAKTDDAWARDIGPTFVSDGKSVRAVDWQFNAWGGEYNGLYADWKKDDAFAQVFASRFGYECYDAHPFVLEGGSIHSDGQGTIMVTETCLLSPGRNPGLTREQIEEKLKDYLGAEKILWLPCGIFNDETDEHVDNVCAFIRPGEVVLAWTEDEKDPQYEMSKRCLEYLEQETDALGRKIVVHKLPIPEHPIRISKQDLEGYVFEEGEDMREVGERLAASYVNFYFSNGAVVLPAFGEENKKSDRQAAELLAKLCPEREVIQVPAKNILLGGGNIHCITQQVIRTESRRMDEKCNSSSNSDELQYRT